MKTFDLKVVPGAKRNAWKEEVSGIKVYLTAPAIDGRANEALIQFLAKKFNVRKSSVNLIRGLKSRQKTVTINDS